jgi:hypothetical protein
MYWPRRTERALAVLSCTWCLTVPRPVCAQTSIEARETEAQRECAAGRYPRGVDILAALFAETHEPTYVYNQGRCYEENGRFAEAITRFREYARKLEGTPDSAAEVAQTESRIKILEDRLAQQRAVPTAAILESRPPETRPIYRRPWFWVAAGAVAAGTVTAVILSMRRPAPSPFCPDCGLMSTPVPAR